MSLEFEEPDLYSEPRYLAVLSILEYQGSATVHEINCYAHTEISLEPEINSLEALGIVKEDEDEHTVRGWFEEDIEAIADLVQIEYNGKWYETELSEDDKRDLEDDGAEIIRWLT